MNTITNPQILKELSKKYAITFCPKFKYYDGDAYNNNKGETLPTYFNLGSRLYQLKYVDGCFNPFLIDVTALIEKKISEAQSRSFNSKIEADRTRALKYIDYLESLYN